MTQFSGQEKTALRLFCRVCDEILECRFVKELPNQDHSIRMSSLRSDGTCDYYQPNYDRDDFRSYMTLFRKLLLEKEQTNIYRVLNILTMHMKDNGELTELKKIKKGLKTMERCGFMDFNLGSDEKPEMYSPRKVYDVVINSDIFHTDADGEKALRKLQEFSPFFEISLVKFMTDISRQAINIAEVIKHRKYFE
jgi:hypothetical protein